MTSLRHKLTAALLATSTWLMAEPTLIQGNAFYYRGKTLELHKYLDLFTFQSQILSEAELQNDGNFKIILDVEKTGLYLLKIDKVNAHIFLIPGEEYTVVLAEPEHDDLINPSKDVFIQPEIFEGNSKLNFQITELEKKINTHIIENLESWVTSESKRSTDELISELNLQFANIADPFFQKYFHFTKAQLELNSGHSRKLVFQKYFETTSPAYDQLSFANAFKLFYNDYMHPKSTKKFSDSLDFYLSKAEFIKAKKLLSTDVFLSSDEVLNLMMINELYLMGKQRIYPIGSILEMLQAAEFNAKIEEQKTTAVDAINSLTKLAPGTRAPDFTFSDIVGNLIRMSDYQGRYIYIQFFGKFSPETVKEMSLMKVLREGYGAEIAMFSVTTDESISSLIEVATEYDFDWYFGKLSNASQSMEDYEIRSTPTYFLIDEKFNLIQSPAPPPGERIERSFARIWKANHPNKDMPFKLQPPPEEGQLPPQPK